MSARIVFDTFIITIEGWGLSDIPNRFQYITLTKLKYKKLFIQIFLLFIDISFNFNVQSKPMYCMSVSNNPYM